MPPPAAGHRRQCLPARQGKAALPVRLAAGSWHGGLPAPQPGVPGCGVPLRHRGTTQRAEQVLGSLRASRGGWQQAGPQAGTEGPPNLVQASPHRSAASVAQLPPGIIVLLGDTLAPAAWGRRDGDPWPRGGGVRRQAGGGTDGRSAKLARAVPRHPGAAAWGLRHRRAAGPGRRGDREGRRRMGTGTGMGTGIGVGQG